MKHTFSSKTRFSVVASVLLLASLISCGSDVGETGEETVSAATVGTEAVTVSEEQQYIDALPDADYGGEEFRILTKTDENSFGTVSLDAEEETGDIFNDFIYRRNRNVEERYNITITVERNDNIDTITRTMVMSGGDEYDMLSNWIKMVLATATEGYYYNLYNVPGIDLSRPWWDAECVELLTIADRLYAAFSDMNVQPLDLLGGYCVNNALVKQHDLPSPQEAVLNGTWTLDMAYEMMRAVAADTNGDGAMTQDDTWGYITGIGDINGLMVSSDRHYIIRDSSGQMQLNYSSSEVIAAAEKMEKMILDPNISVYMNKYAWGWDVFPAGRALFMANSIRAFYHDWRALDLDISLVPSPKFDENQSEYHALMSNCSMGVSVPATASDPERTGNIIEAMNAYSYKAINDVYYEITLQDKLARDEYSSQMLDIIVNARTVDIAVLNENAWGNVVSAFMSSFESKGASNLASLEEKYRKSFEKIRDGIVEAYEGLDT